jgi:N-acetylmuramoyl-L-alanine amidase
MILKLRVGTYPAYTRVVLDTAEPLEWFVRQRGPKNLSIMVPGGVLAPGIHAVHRLHGILRAMDPRQLPSGVEITLLLQPGPLTVRSFALQAPDRVVVDLRRGDTPEPNGPRVPVEPGEAARAWGAGDPARVPSPSGGSPEGTNAREAASARGLTPDRNQLTIVLDPGHGGQDTGAVGPTGLTEKAVVLDLALRLRRLLQERLGARVILTRSEDVFIPLPARSALANRVKADFFISLHMNGSNQQDAAGFETFYYTREPSDTDARTSVQRENLVLNPKGRTGPAETALLRSTLADLAVSRDMEESGELAELELSALSRWMHLENRGVKSGPFYVLATAGMPAVLVESAFITIPAHERSLRQEVYRQRLAEALYDGIRAFSARYVRRVATRDAPVTRSSSLGHLRATGRVQNQPW